MQDSIKEELKKEVKSLKEQISALQQENALLSRKDNEHPEPPLQNDQIEQHRIVDQLFNISTPLCFISSDLKIKLINDSFCETFNIRKQDILNSECFKIWQGPLCETGDCVLKQIMAGKKQVSYEMQRDLPNKKNVTLLIKAKPFFDENNQIIGIVESFIDISKLKQAEARLQESEERFKFLSKATFEGIVVHKKGIVLDANDSFLKMTGYSREEAIGKNLLNYIPKARDRAKILKNIIKRKAEPYTIAAERKDGSLFTAELEAKNVKYLGKTVRIAAVRDVTDREKALQNLQESEAKYHALFKNMVNGFALHKIITDDKNNPVDYEFIEVNDAFEKQTGLKREALIGKRVTKVLPDTENDPADWIGKYGQVALKGKELRLENYFKNLDKWFSVTAFSSQKGYFATIVEDITDKKRSEEKLKKLIEESKRKENEISELLTAAHAILEKDDFNQVARQIFDACARSIGAKAGYVALMSEDGQENELLFLEAGGMKCDVEPDLPMPIRGLRAEAYKTGKVVYDNDFMKSEWLKYMPAGHMPLPNVLFAPLNIEGKTVGIMGFACKDGDFNEHDAKLAAAFGEYAAIALNNSRIFDALEKSEQAYSKLIHSVGEGIGIIDEDEVFTFCNEAAAEIFELPPGNLQGRSLSEFVSQTDMARMLQETAKRKTGESSSYELKFTSAQGNEKYIWVTASPNHDANGNIVSTFGIFFDITDRKIAEEKIQDLLKEKEILLREVHHRIKNNMATIESLLHLHSTGSDSKEVKTSLQEAGGRIRSMQMLYDKLYRSDNFSEVNMLDYLSPLIDEIVAVFPDKKDVKVTKEIEDFLIDAKFVFPLGIIINELITNIMKYAFEGRKKNEIKVSAKLRDDIVEMIIQDNGIGIGETQNLEKSTGFGLQLVNMLTEQLKGKVQIESEKGTKFILEFKVRK